MQREQEVLQLCVATTLRKCQYIFDNRNLRKQTVFMSPGVMKGTNTPISLAQTIGHIR